METMFQHKWEWEILVAPTGICHGIDGIDMNHSSAKPGDVCEMLFRLKKREAIREQGWISKLSIRDCAGRLKQHMANKDMDLTVCTI